MNMKRKAVCVFFVLLAAALIAYFTWLPSLFAPRDSGFSMDLFFNVHADLVNINEAPAAELCTLEGIGEQKAQAIIAYRTQEKTFDEIEELLQVEGISQTIYDKIKNDICVK